MHRSSNLNMPHNVGNSNGTPGGRNGDRTSNVTPGTPPSPTPATWPLVSPLSKVLRPRLRIGGCCSMVVTNHRDHVQTMSTMSTMSSDGFLQKFAPPSCAPTAVSFLLSRVPCSALMWKCDTAIVRSDHGTLGNAFHFHVRLRSHGRTARRVEGVRNPPELLRADVPSAAYYSPAVT